MGVGYELDAIAMTVIGGMSLSGGRGSIIGTVLGALIFGVIISGFTFLRLDAYYQEMVKGVIIVGAVVLDVNGGSAGAAAAREAEMTDRTPTIILETEGLTKHYGGVHALEDANFELRQGEHVAIVGDNGAGKSTFVRQITGVEQPNRGQDLLRGQGGRFQGADRGARSRHRNRVPEPRAGRRSRRAVQPVSRPREDAASTSGRSPSSTSKLMCARPREALATTGVKIPNLENTIRNMSGGQRQCVAIGRAATFASKLIIMDEPTAALGVQETAQVENIIRNLKKRGDPADPDQPQSAPGLRPRRPHRGLPARPDRRRRRPRQDDRQRCGLHDHRRHLRRRRRARLCLSEREFRAGRSGSRCRDRGSASHSG